MTTTPEKSRMAEKSPLSPQDLFGVVVRSIGIFFLCFALAYSLQMLAGMIGNPYSEVSGYFLYAVCYFVLGMFFLTRADRVVQFAYPAPKEVVPTDPK